MDTTLLSVIPVLPSADVPRDIAWYGAKTGFECIFSTAFPDSGLVNYAALRRGPLVLHLQWHANTPEDPLLGGSVIRIWVENIRPLFAEMIERGTVTPADFRANTPWGTNEFGFYDLNRNAIFILEDVPA